MNNENYIHPLLHSLHTVKDEAHFGKFPCECCGSRLAGDRYDCEALRHDDSPKGNGIALLADTFAVCPDCVVKWQ